jgi:hypothetical protein
MSIKVEDYENIRDLRTALEMEHGSGEDDGCGGREWTTEEEEDRTTVISVEYMGCQTHRVTTTHVFHTGAMKAASYHRNFAFL